MFSSYRALLARPGARPLLAASAVAWFSYSVYGLGLVLVIERGTGSFSTAGAAIAAFSLGSAAFAPVRGRLVDRRGARGLCALAMTHVALLAALVVVAARGGPAPTIVVLAGLGGAAVPPLIAVSRTRWADVAGEVHAPAGHALNAAVGEGAQVLGPLAIAAAVVVVPPAVPVAVLLAGLLLATRLMGGPPGAATISEGVEPARRHGSWRPPGGMAFGVLAVGEAMLGLGFGALDVALPAHSAAHGSAADAAVPLAVLAAGSAGAALLAGAYARSLPAAARFVGGLALAALGLGLVALAPAGVLVAVACAPAGAGLGLAFAAVFELLDDVVDPARSVEAFTWLTTAAGAGSAIGAALAGLLADDPARAMLVAPAAVAVATLIAAAAFARGDALVVPAVAERQA